MEYWNAPVQSILSLIWWSWGRDPSIPRTRRGTQKMKRNKTRILYITSFLIQKKNLRHQLTFNSSNLVSRTIIPASTPSDFWKVEVYWLMNETTECFLTKFLKNEGNIHLTTENEVLVSSTRIRILTRWAKTIKSPTNCQGFLPGMYMLHSVRHVLSYILLKEQLRTFRLSDRDKMVTKGM